MRRLWRCSCCCRLVNGELCRLFVCLINANDLQLLVARRLNRSNCYGRSKTVRSSEKLLRILQLFEVDGVNMLILMPLLLR